MRLSIDVKPDGAVRDPSLVQPIGRVMGVVDHDGDGSRVTIVVDLDEDKLRARLAEERRAF